MRNDRVNAYKMCLEQYANSRTMLLWTVRLCKPVGLKAILPDGHGLTISQHRHRVSRQ